MDDVTAYRNLLRKYGGDTDAIDALVVRITAATDMSALPALFETLKLEAEKADWLLDRDYAAVALQAALPLTSSPALRRKMLSFALERARWCQQCSTAGGEALARGQHISELETLGREHS